MSPSLLRRLEAVGFIPGELNPEVWAVNEIERLYEVLARPAPVASASRDASVRVWITDEGASLCGWSGLPPQNGDTVTAIISGDGCQPENRERVKLRVVHRDWLHRVDHPLVGGGCGPPHVVTECFVHGDIIARERL